jgi:hypothetical protein
MKDKVESFDEVSFFVIAYYQARVQFEELLEVISSEDLAEAIFANVLTCLFSLV